LVILATILISFIGAKIAGRFAQLFQVPVTLSVNPIYSLNLDVDIISRNVLPNSTFCKHE
jgi:hypothetical protein